MPQKEPQTISLKPREPFKAEAALDTAPLAEHRRRVPLDRAPVDDPSGEVLQEDPVARDEQARSGDWGQAGRVVLAKGLRMIDYGCPLMTDIQKETLEAFDAVVHLDIAHKTAFQAIRASTLLESQFRGSQDLSIADEGDHLS